MSTSLQDALAQIDFADAAALVPAPWWWESLRDPPAFWTALLPRLSPPSALPAKSQLGRGFDFYHDAVARHLPYHGGRVALRGFVSDRSWQTLTLAQIHAQTAMLAAQWQALGMAPGARVALVLPSGAGQLVGLLALLRLGVCACVLPPLGERFLTHRLSALKPSHVISVPLYQPILRQWEPVMMGEGTSVPPLLGEPRSYTYAPDEPALAVFSSTRSGSALPVLISSQAAYCNALRDGCIVYALRPGDRLAAPGVCPLKYQPALLLAVLLAGASYLDVSPQQVRQDPDIISGSVLRTLIVSDALREVLGASPPSLAGLALWLRDIEEPGQRWPEFIRSSRLEKVPCGNVVVDAAAGGCRLVSGRQRGVVSAHVLPAPGCRYTLLDLTLSGPACGGSGVFADPVAAADDGAADPEHSGDYIVLSAVRDEYLYCGTLSPRRGGRVYPADEVMGALVSLPELVGVSILSTLGAGEAPKNLFVLLAFTGAPRDGERAPEAALAQVIRQRLRHDLGEQALPDEIRIIFSYPRQKIVDGKAEIDHAWVRGQFFSGALHQKPRQRIFQLLTKLRRAVYGAQAPR